MLGATKQNEFKDVSINIRFTLLLVSSLLYELRQIDNRHWIRGLWVQIRPGSMDFFRA